jgi:hypothetical protein
MIVLDFYHHFKNNDFSSVALKQKEIFRERICVLSSAVSAVFEFKASKE